MNPILVDFSVQALAGIVGVFVGVWLALVADRYKRRRDDRRREDEAVRQFERALHSILGSVVKNTAEARHIHMRASRHEACKPIHAVLESSVWDATQDQFMQMCQNVDERIIFAQFFDGIRRLQAFVEFHRDLQITLAGATDAKDPELAAIGRDADQQLMDLAEDVRLCGVILIADHGQPVHQRMVGMKHRVPAAVAEPASGRARV